MSDDFGKNSASLIKNVAIGTAGVLGTVAAGAGGAVAAVAFTTSAAEWFSQFASGNDVAFSDARVAAVEEECRKLDTRLAQLEAERAGTGTKEAPPDVLHREAVYSEFAKAVASAATPEKRMALVNAAARQFDPRSGSAASRAHWFERVRALSGIEVQVIGLVAKHGSVAFDEQALKVTLNEGHSAVQRVDPIPGIEIDEIVALENAAIRASNEAPEQLLTRFAFPLNLAARGTQGRPVFWLTRTGASLARFIVD